MGRELANWPQRVGAYLIDYLIAGIPVFLAIVLFSGTDPGETPSAGAGLVTFLLYLVSFGIWIYNRVIQMGRTGQSWGKQVLNLRLVRMADGQPMGGGMASSATCSTSWTPCSATSASCGRSGTPGASACSPTRS